jgi:ATP-dependent phosphofructokinase / diphosphate-dependent phosphofructokinase
MQEETCMMKIGMLTSGGDCQALNAAMRGVVKGLTTNVDELEIYGFENGYKGLIYEQYRILTASDFSGILTRGGTILGSSRQPFKQMRVPDENGLDKVEAMKSTYRKLGLDCLVILGGNGTQKTANLLREEGLNIIHLPKTIDNDIYGTDVTFGFQSAINIATETIDCIHTTAASHNRVFIVEVMGHKVGWLTLTCRAFSTGTSVYRVFTIYCFCKNLCDCGFSGTPGTTKQISMSYAIGFDLVL